MARNVLLWLVVVVIVIIGGGFYIRSRESDISKIAHITSLSQITNISAMECWYEVGDYGTGSGASMYIYNNMLRVSIQELTISGFSGSVQAILGVDGTRLIDPATIQAAGGATNAANVLNTVITQAPWRCQPWWFPSPSLFQIPNAVSF